MTANQIAYWNLQESKRANQAKEELGTKQHTETVRSNLAREDIDRGKLAETHRANTANEMFTKQRLGIEQQNANTNLQRVKEDTRHNWATEITQRGKVEADYALGKRANELKLLDFEEQWRRQNRDLDDKQASRATKFITDFIDALIPA